MIPKFIVAAQNKGVIMEVSFDEQLKFITSVQSTIRAEAQDIVKERHVDAYSSAETNELDAALSKAQGEYPRIDYNRISKYFQKDYADLFAILTPVLPVLSKYNLNIRQTQKFMDGQLVLITKLSHASGQWVESRARIIPSKNDPQSILSTKNMIKRDELMSVLCLSIANDPYDDNAERQMADDRQAFAKGTQAPVLYNPRERSTECISQDQLSMLEKELAPIPDFVEEIFKGAVIDSLADLPKDKFNYTVDKIRKVKEVRSGRRSNAD